jgi:hypothetical protein
MVWEVKEKDQVSYPRRRARAVDMMRQELAKGGAEFSRFT